jgi:predicted dienelactone hydrolase
MAINEQLSETSDWRAQIALLNKANAMMPEGSMDSMNEALAIWAEDQLFVLSEIEKFQSGEKASATSEVLDFKSHLDLSNLGFFGMSFGGSTSLDNCVKDSRCKAGINMDGFMASQMQLPPLQKPFMFMNSEDNLLYNAMYEIAESDVYSVRVEGSNHLNYLDFSIMSPLYKMMGVLGQIEGYKMLAITEDYVLGFFDKYLKDETSALLDDSADNSVGKYKEVEFRKKSKNP